MLKKLASVAIGAILAACLVPSMAIAQSTDSSAVDRGVSARAAATTALNSSAIAAATTDITNADVVNAGETYSGDTKDGGGTATWTIANGVLTVSGGSQKNPTMGEYGYQKWPWLEHGESVTSVVVKGNFTELGVGAFECLPNLTSCTLPSTLKSTGDYAFEDCPNLSSVTLPNGLTTIGEGCFYGCPKLTSITLPTSVTAIKEESFECAGITSITIPDKVKEIGGRAFFDCEQLETVTFPSKLETISESAFSYCSALTDIIIPATCTSIEEQAFYRCTALKNVVIPAGITVSNKAFVEMASGSTIYASDLAAAAKLRSGDYITTANTTVAAGLPSLSDCTVKLAYTSTTYTGNAQKPAVTVKLGKALVTSGYQVLYANNVKAGKASAVITSNAYPLSSGGIESKYFTIKQAKQDLRVSTRIAAVNYNGSITKAAYPISTITTTGGALVEKIASDGSITIGEAYGKLGAITFTKMSGSDYLSITTAGKISGKVTVQPKTPVGEYTMVVRVTAAATADGNYKKTSKDVTVKVQVKRFTPTITVTSKVSPNKMYSATKSQTVTMIKSVQCAAKPLKYSLVKVMDGDGKKVSDALAAKFKVDPATGVVTFKAGTPRGTYKVMFKISSPAVDGYNANWRTATGTFRIV